MFEQENLSYLGQLVVDSEHLLSRKYEGAEDITKRVLDLFDVLEMEPERITEGDYKEIVEADASQIGRPGPHLLHTRNVAKISSNLVSRLSDKHPDLDLPSPKKAFVYGLIHDLAATFSFYGRDDLKQASKELPQYVIAAEFGLQDLADSSMHGSYFGLLKMIKNSEGVFSGSHYAAWAEALNNSEHPHNYGAIMSCFGEFVHGKDKLGLIVLSVADCIDVPGAEVSVDEISSGNLLQRFGIRLDDIETRYVNTPLGIALSQGGRDRMENYVRVVSAFLNGDVPEGYGPREAPGLWKT